MHNFSHIFTLIQYNTVCVHIDIKSANNSLQLAHWLTVRHKTPSAILKPHVSSVCSYSKVRTARTFMLPCSELFHYCLLRSTGNNQWSSPKGKLEMSSVGWSDCFPHFVKNHHMQTLKQPVCSANNKGRILKVLHNWINICSLDIAHMIV